MRFICGIKLLLQGKWFILARITLTNYYNNSFIKTIYYT